MTSIGLRYQANGPSADGTPLYRIVYFTQTVSARPISSDSLQEVLSYLYFDGLQGLVKEHFENIQRLMQMVFDTGVSLDRIEFHLQFDIFAGWTITAFGLGPEPRMTFASVEELRDRLRQDYGIQPSPKGP